MRIVSYMLGGLCPLDHMAIENLILETWEGREAALLFYINGPSVVIGRNQNPWREAAPGTGLPLFRRCSGGGAVYHDEGNLNWALIVPRALHSQDAELAMVAAAISAQGVDAVPGPRGGLYCGTASPHEGRKLSGTARRFGIRNVLHHGTLLVNADMDRLHASLGGIATFDDLSLRSVSASPINLSALNPAVAMDSLIDGLSQRLSGAPTQSLPATVVDPTREEQEKRKLSSFEWIYSSTAPFSVRLTGPGEGFAVRVEKGLIAAISSGGPDSSMAAVGSSVTDGLGSTDDWSAHYGEGDISCLSDYRGRPFSFSIYESMIAAIRAR
ncbi:MAG TPA: biotin/lipoate A/B protein ligase family protein [Rectinemataceae bacterium]|nr:biotin/lipoate A/B protein ligase family protein [Rectinemataceae bacterium]